MSIIVGIDLGTTNSCVAVPASADIPDRDALIETRRLRPVGDALVITNPDRSPTMPSAVWIDQDGAALVGMRAKRKARTSRQPPAMFFKRNMGTDQRVTAGHDTLTPMQASAHILSKLKELAEEVLTIPVERAIITVPAFFETRAKNETTQAGAIAGLEVVETLIEPVAAAMAYTHDKKQDMSRRQNFLVYDLGGGTFDTSVVSWDPELGFENRSFDGDRYLGGYDFDRRIVNWMVGQLPTYDLAISPDDPADMAVHASLMALAEEAKHELARDTFAEIVSQHCVDRRGEVMNLNLELERAEFEAMIGPQLEGTLANCTRSLERAAVRPADLAEIVMVGGSSRILMVARLLEEHFGRRPRLMNPDLCIAVGAALKAATATTRSGVLEVDRPDPTPPFTDISGRVLAGGELTSPAGVSIVLTSDDGAQRRRETTGSDGTFLFEDVQLHAQRDNGFTIQVQAGGREVAAEQLLVRPVGAGAGTTQIVETGDVLAHDFSLQLKSGLHPVVHTGTKLPYTATFQLETASRGTALQVRLVEGMVPIGEVVVHDVPTDLPIGTPVEVTLDFQLGWTIRAQAGIPSISASATAVIDIPVRQVPAWPELRRRYADTQASWAEKRDAIPATEAMRIGPVIDALLSEIGMLLREGHDRAKAHHKLLEAETQVDNVRVFEGRSTDMQPPLDDFEAALATLTTLIGKLAGQDPAKAARHRTGLAALEAAGRAAYQSGNRMDWAQVNNAVRDRILAVDRDLPDQGPGAHSISPPELQAALLHEIEGIAGSVRRIDAVTDGAHHARAEQLLGDLAGAARTISSVNPSSSDAERVLWTTFQNTIQPLRARIERWIREIQDGGLSDGVILPDLPKGPRG